MNVEIGIIGLAQSGRTTIFNTLTRGTARTGTYTQEASAPHIGTAMVPEPRLKVLADMFHPERVVPSSVTYIDVGASIKGLVKDKGIGGQLLAQLSKVETLITVIRAFKDDRIPNVAGSLDVTRDIANMTLELTFSDLALVDRRLERIEAALKGAKPLERPGLLREQALITKLKDSLEKEVPVRELTLTPEETRAITSYQFLTAKPLLIVVNIGEDQLAQAESLEKELGQCYARPKCRLITVCSKVEMELAQLEENAAAELRAGFGIKEPGTDRIIQLSYALLGLISFFTVGPDEVRAWPIPIGTEAVKAASKIHSDIEKGFIRAEVISYDDLVKCGSLAEARKKGLLRLEGKNYIVQDGDIVTFLFNV